MRNHKYRMKVNGEVSMVFPDVGSGGEQWAIRVLAPLRQRNMNPDAMPWILHGFTKKELAICLDDLGVVDPDRANIIQSYAASAREALHT